MNSAWTAYEEGYDAGYCDEGTDSCSYVTGTPEHDDWMSGFDDGLAELCAEEEEE